MYKFTNGIVVFDEKTRDAYLKAGYKLVKERKAKEVKLEDENTSNDGTIKRQPKKYNKLSK